MTALLLLLLLILTLAAAQQRPLSSAVELAALYSLRSSLALRSRDWPRKSDPCAAWSGVSCSSDGRVVALQLAGLRRTRLGRLDPRFAVDGLQNLTLLADFNASGFPLPGSIPDWFGAGGVPPLSLLDLSSCSVSGSIPPAVGGFVNLIYLNLSGNSISGGIPDQLFSRLGSLSVLDVNGNRLTGSIPTSLPSATNLTVINLAGNFLAGSIPAGVGTVVNLAVLDLSNNGLSGSVPAALGDLARLRRLDLGLNSLSGTLPADLSGLTSLQMFSLRRNTLTGEIPDGLFNRLLQLQTLVLAGNGFSGDLPPAVWRIPGLTVLDLSSNNFTGGLPGRSSPNAPATAIFNLSHNQLYGTLQLADLTGLGFVDISDNYFQGSVPNARLNASLSNNCLRNQTNQKSTQVCRSFYAARGLQFDDGLAPPTGAPESQPATRRRSRRTWRYVLAGVLGGLGFILILMLVMVLLLRWRRASGSESRGGDVRVVQPPPPTPATGALSPAVLISRTFGGEVYTYEQLLRATQEFSDKNLIKHGHSGDLYLGKLDNGVSVVVKKVEADLARKGGYMVELELFSRPSHFRLVPFLGHCMEQESVKFLVYKYMPNGDLSSALYRKTGGEEDGLQSLDWITRLKIALGVAEALAYLHHECNPPLVHRDIQASSVLLDDKFEVRLGSLSEICPQEGDVHQSVFTRFLRMSQTSDQGSSGSSSTCAYDVYCLGKVLLELVTGKLGISGSSDASVNEWLDQVLPYINIYKKDMLPKIVDPSLIVDEDLLQEVWAMAIVAKSCLNPKPSKRPLTRYVVKALENPLKIVREDNNNGGSARLRTTSSRGSWSSAFFGSWRHSSSDIVAPGAPTINREGSNLRQVGRTGSHGSARSGDFPSSHKRLSKEIFPEPSNPTIERGEERSDNSNFRE